MAGNSVASLDALMRQAERRLAVQPLHTGIERYFEISLYLLVATGFATLASTGRLEVPALAMVTAALLFRGYLLVRGRRVSLPERWTSLLTVGYVLFYVCDYYFVSGTFVAATVHLVLFSMVLKLFSAQRDRDHIYLATLAFLSVLAAAVLTVDTAFLGMFAVFLLLAVTTFVSMEMRRSSRAAAVRAREGSLRTRALAVALCTTGVAIVAGMLVLGGAIFFVLPRLSAGYFSNFAPRNEFVSGFSENIQLGQIGEIKQSDAVVMHVQFEGDPGGATDMKWRGLALANFDGRRWFNFPGQGTIQRSAGGQFDLLPEQVRRDNLPADLPTDQYRAVEYTVTMEPLGTNVVFLAPVPTAVSSEFQQISIDESGAVFNQDRRRVLDGYRAVSLLPLGDATGPRPAPLSTPARIAILYGQLPRLDARVRALAQQITVTAEADHDKAAAIEQYLKTRYAYTLDLGTRAPADPLAYFLFERKEGHCEYFASAMAIMLRTVGIPSRIVNGFRGAEYNDLTGSYIVRARNAHSWVEAYVGGRWVSFDPTPPDPRASSSRWHRFLLYVDAAGEFWREWVILYDFERRHTLTTAAVSESQSLFARMARRVRRSYDILLDGARVLLKRGAEDPRRWSMYGVGVVVAILILLKLPSMWRTLRRYRVARHPQRAPQAAASIWYTRLTARLARHGWRKLPAQTPQEFAASISDPAVAAPVTQFIVHYERARFGNSAKDAARLPELFEQMRSFK